MFNKSFFLVFISLLVFSCKTESKKSAENIEDRSHTSEEIKNKSKIRKQIDTIGFAQYGWQMDSLINRISAEDKTKNNIANKAAISPHDDYKYAAGLYYKTLKGIKAKTIVLIGVAHKARNFELQDKLVFGSFDAWKAPYGNIKISGFRDSLVSKLAKETYVVHDSMVQTEHSLEAITPFLQYKNKEVEIIPILIPYMKFEDMQQFSSQLSDALAVLMKSNNLNYGEDLAVVISTDAVHYGDEDWGGSDMAPFGANEEGNTKAKQKDEQILKDWLSGSLLEENIEKFAKTTVKYPDYKEYDWVWCGRYSVPFGLLTANKLNQKLNAKNLNGNSLDYRSSIHNPHLKVEDIGLGTTAPANEHHWVGYVGVLYQ